LSSCRCDSLADASADRNLAALVDFVPIWSRPNGTTGKFGVSELPSDPLILADPIIAPVSGVGIIGTVVVFMRQGQELGLSVLGNSKYDGSILEPTY
jgi:hypothetical protein